MALIRTCVLLLLIAFTRAEDECKDNIAICGAFSAKHCTLYTKWARVTCQKTCGFCGSVCPKDWSYSESNKICFQIFGMTDSAERKSWSEARSFCQAKGGNLVMVKSHADNDLIEKSLSNGVYYWIGLKNVAKTGEMHFKYVDGNDLKSESYKNWKYDQPDNWRNSEYCVIMLATGVWSDFNCSSRQAFICQKQVV